tara:strand:- start:233 stop:1195 length:963 start_codon:yes stop_codon:yes gene_type:complete
MTKKKTPPTKSKAKKATAVAPKKPVKSASKAKATKATKAKPAVKKPPASKARKPATKPPRKTKAPSSKSNETAGDGEKKVREIANQTSSDATEEKVETKGFSMDDVRSILSRRDDDEQDAEASDIDQAKSGAAKGKGSVAKKSKASKVKKVQTASIDDILGLAPSTASARPIRDEKKVPKQWLSYYNDLMSLRASLKGALGERSSETLGASARESSGELSLNSSDAGTETFNRDVALSMVASEQEALDEIEDAIDRIFDGSYGICQETEKPIKKTRLKVVPFTRFSLEGQNLYEQRKRREGDPVTGAFATISESTMGQED